MIQRLVVNGCSYMDVYAAGGGHMALAKNLNIEKCKSLAQTGCNNSRILRTTLKDSYLTDVPTFYVLGMTFVNRSEIPILKCENEDSSFEGRWTNPQNLMYSNRWEHFWSEKDTNEFVALREKESVYGGLDFIEDLMYRMLSTIGDLQLRGHRVIMYQQADMGHHNLLDSPRLKLFKNNKNIIDGFRWCSIQWQHRQGVPYLPGDHKNRYGTTPEEMRHRQSGQHHVLNEFLTNYIKEYRILE